MAHVAPTRPRDVLARLVQPLQSWLAADVPNGVVFVTGTATMVFPFDRRLNTESKLSPLVRSAHELAIAVPLVMTKGPEPGAWLNRVVGDSVLVESHAR